MTWSDGRADQLRFFGFFFGVVSRLHRVRCRSVYFPWATIWQLRRFSRSRTFKGYCMVFPIVALRRRQRRMKRQFSCAV
jgi:hypothetical protein